MADKLAEPSRSQQGLFALARVTVENARRRRSRLAATLEVATLLDKLHPQGRPGRLPKSNAVVATKQPLHLLLRAEQLRRPHKPGSDLLNGYVLGQWLQGLRVIESSLANLVADERDLQVAQLVPKLLNVVFIHVAEAQVRYVHLMNFGALVEDVALM